MIATIWQYAVHAITGNGNYANLLKIYFEKFVKSQKVNLFLAGFRHLEPMCSLKQPLATLADKVLCRGCSCNDQRRSSQSDIAKLESVIGFKVSRLKRGIYLPKCWVEFQLQGNPWLFLVLKLSIFGSILRTICTKYEYAFQGHISR